MGNSNKYLRDALFDLNRRVNDADTFEEKQLYRSYIYSLLGGIANTGMDIELPNSLLYKSAIYYNTIDENYNRKMLLSYRSNLYFYRKFAGLANSVYDYFLEDSYKFIEKLSFEDSIDLIRGFFEYYDKDISSHFNYLLDNNLIHVYLPYGEDAENYDGFTYPIPGNGNLIIAQDKGNIDTAVTIAHEVIHSFLALDDINITYDQDIRKSINDVDEVYPKLIELLFMRYLADIGFNKTDISSFMKNYNSSLCEFISIFDDIIQDRENKILSDNFDLFCNAKTYSLGYVLAYHYLDKYMDSPYIVKDDLLRLNHETKFRDFPYLLDNCGLKKKDIVKPKILLKRMDDFNY